MSRSDSTVGRPDPRVSLIVVVLSGVLFVAIAAIFVPWQWLPGGHVHAVPADSVFSAAQIERGEHVSGTLRHTAWASLAVSLLVSLVLGGTRWGARLVARLPGHWTVKVVLGVGAVTMIGAVAILPFGWRLQRIDLHQGLSNQAWGSWAEDQVLGLAITWLFTAVAILALMAIARRSPRNWPAWCAAAAAVLAVVGSYVYPIAVEPLFNHFTPMAAGPLRTDILRLAAKEHVHIDDVLVADASRRTTTLNAYVSGFGSTRRVVVYDNLLKDLPRAQVEVVVAHELGHARHQDVLTGTLLGAVGSAFGVGLLGLVLSRRRFRERVGADGLADPRMVPALLMLVAVGTLLASPVQNTISRGIEARADRASLQATGQTATFVSMQKELALHALADPTPPRWSQFWFGTHPTVLQRIGMAEELAADTRK